MAVVLDRPDMGRRPELDPGGLAGDMVVPANKAPEPLGQRIMMPLQAMPGGTTINAPSPRSSWKHLAHGMLEPSNAFFSTS